VLALTGGRFLALLVDANRESEIVERLYRHSDFWVKPFFGMFDLSNEAVESSGGIFEPASLIAFAVYLVIGLIVLALLGSPVLGGWSLGARRHGHA
jgi:hypothetical protein